MYRYNSIAFIKLYPCFRHEPLKSTTLNSAAATFHLYMRQHFWWKCIVYKSKEWCNSEAQINNLCSIYEKGLLSMYWTFTFHNGIAWDNFNESLCFYEQ